MKNLALKIKISAGKIFSLFFYRSLGGNSVLNYQGAKLIDRQIIDNEINYIYDLYEQDKEPKKNASLKVGLKNLVSVWTFQSKDYELFNGHLYNGCRVYYSEGNFTIRMINLFRKNFTYIDGDVLYFSNSNQSHYGHFVFYVVPMLSIAKKYFDIKRVYAGNFVKCKFFTEIMRNSFPEIEVLTGNIKAKKIIYVNIDKLKSLSGHKVLSPEILLQAKNSLKNLAASKSENKYENIFVGRGDVKWRKLVNENELIENLKSFGFTYVTMDKLNPVDQASLFSNAKFIIGVHGGAMSNVIHCKKGTKVIELIAYNHEDYTTLELCSATECSYTRIISNPIDLDTPPPYRNLQADIYQINKILSESCKI